MSSSVPPFLRWYTSVYAETPVSCIVPLCLRCYVRTSVYLCAPPFMGRYPRFPMCTSVSSSLPLCVTSVLGRYLRFPMCTSVSSSLPLCVTSLSSSVSPYLSVPPFTVCALLFAGTSVCNIFSSSVSPCATFFLRRYLRVSVGAPVFSSLPSCLLGYLRSPCCISSSCSVPPCLGRHLLEGYLRVRSRGGSGGTDEKTG